jgi:hypothetical protein
LLVVGCWYLVVGCWLLVVGCWLLAVGCWLVVFGFWLLVIGCWLLVVGRVGYRCVLLVSMLGVIQENAEFGCTQLPTTNVPNDRKCT